jgi:hypothetical protein
MQAADRAHGDRQRPPPASPAHSAVPPPRPASPCARSRPSLVAARRRYRPSARSASTRRTNCVSAIALGRHWPRSQRWTERPVRPFCPIVTRIPSSWASSACVSPRRFRRRRMTSGVIASPQFPPHPGGAAETPIALVSRSPPTPVGLRSSRNHVLHGGSDLFRHHQPRQVAGARCAASSRLRRVRIACDRDCDAHRPETTMRTVRAQVGHRFACLWVHEWLQVREIPRSGG